MGIAALMLLVLAGLSYQEWRRYSQANAAAVQSGEVRDSIDRLLAGLVNAETGQRGFLLTGEVRYLEPYNQAIQAIPRELAKLRSSLADVSRLSDLVDQKLAELRRTVELRRRQGVAPALEVVLSDEGKRIMDEIRGICSRVQRSESSAQQAVSLEREAVAKTALLATIVVALILLFFFAAGLTTANDAPAGKMSAPLAAYGAAIAATVAAVLLRSALTPLLGQGGTPLAFTMFFPAVLFSSWYGGFRAGAVCILLSAIAADYFFVAPFRSFEIARPADLVGLLVFVLVASGVALLAGSQKQAVERADREASQRRDAESAERAQRRRFETTLASIGDAVVATDSEGRIVFANAVAGSLMGWPKDDLSGKQLDEVFRIVNENSREKVESPVTKVLREGQIVGLANHTVLIARNGTELPIDDSGAPIRGDGGEIQGTVLVFRDITERRRAENALIERERRFREAANGAPVLIWVAGLDKGCTWFNRPWLEFTGRTMEQEMGDGWAEGVHADDLDKCLEVYIGSFERRDPFQMEYRLRRHDGQWRWVLDHGIPLLDDSRTFLGYIGSCVDVTAQKEAEETLRNTNAALREYADIVDPAAALVLDNGGHIIRWSSGAQALYGLSAAEALGKVSHEVFQTGFPEPLEEIRAKLEANGRWEGELRHQTPRGEIVVASTWALHRDKDGAPAAILEVNTDITERKRLEQELRKLAGIVESSDDAMISKTLECTITSWNWGAERMYGYSAEEAIGRKIALLVPPGYEDEMPSLMERVRQGEAIEKYQTKRRCKDGSIIDVSLTVSPLVSGRGDVMGAAVVARDVTEEVSAAERLARLNAELQQSNKDLTRSNEDLERFAFVASHDLQEPLRMITSYAQLLVKTHGEPNRDAEMFVANIVDGTQRMRNLLSDLLAYTEIGSGVAEPTEAVDLNLVLEDVRRDLRVSIEESGSVITSSRLPAITAHRSHFVSLFQNLVGNAIKYRSAAPPRIHISLEEMDGHMRIGVADNGCGIDPEYHERIFEIFKRLHDRTIPGTGVGLAICQRVVERYGGRIWVESEAGQGATFFFTLPGHARERPLP